MAEGLENERSALIGEMFRRLASFQSNGKFCDVQVEVGNRRFSCHRVVLASASPVFEAMFSGEMKESGEEAVKIGNVEEVTPDEQEECFQSVVDFIYSSDRFRITDENCANLMFAGSYFEVMSLLYCIYPIPN